MFYLNYLGAISMHIKRWYPLHKIVGLYTPCILLFYCAIFWGRDMFGWKCGTKGYNFDLFPSQRIIWGLFRGFYGVFPCRIWRQLWPFRSLYPPPSNSYPSIPHCISLMFKADSSKCCSWWPGPTRSIWPGLVAHLPLLGREARLTFPHRPDLHRLQVSVPPGPASPLRKPSVQPVAFRRSNRLDGNHNALWLNINTSS